MYACMLYKFNYPLYILCYDLCIFNQYISIYSVVVSVIRKKIKKKDIYKYIPKRK